jgi:hypothetical protein
VYALTLRYDDKCNIHWEEVEGLGEC